MIVRGFSTAVAAAAVLAAATLAAQPSQEERVRTFAALPNWTGYWIAESFAGLNVSGRFADPAAAPPVQLRKTPPYTQEWAAKVAALQTPQSRSTSKECGFPFPFVMESPWSFQFLITPEETAVIAGGREVRHIYTDGRAHPPAEDLWANPWGDSIGRWEGQVLVVDTVAVQTSRFPPVVSEQARFTERLRMLDADTMENVITVEDPMALTEPWTVTIPYRRVATLDRMVHGDCAENDRNPVVDGAITIVPAAGK
jgi:hypothetical protein